MSKREAKCKTNSEKGKRRISSHRCLNPMLWNCVELFESIPVSLYILMLFRMLSNAVCVYT